MEMQLSAHMCACAPVCMCYKVNPYKHILNRRTLDFLLIARVPLCWCARQQVFALAPRHTSSPVSTHPVLQLWSGGPGWWSLCHPSHMEKTETFPGLFYPNSLLSLSHAHTQTPTHTHTHQLDIPVLSQLASGCRARKQEAPPLGQLFQTPSLPWAPHSLIQGSFVVLTSWNSWAAQLLMLL